MKKIINYIFWPALAGLVFALTVMQLPRLSEAFYGMASTDSEPLELDRSNLPLSFSSAIAKVMPSVVTINLQQMFTDSGNTQNINDTLSGIINQNSTP